MAATESGNRRADAQGKKTLWVAASDPPAPIPSGLAPAGLRSSNPRQIHSDLESGEVGHVVVDCTRPLIDPVAFVVRLRLKDPHIGIQLMVRHADQSELAARLSKEKIADVQWVVIDTDISPG